MSTSGPPLNNACASAVLAALVGLAFAAVPAARWLAVWSQAPDGPYGEVIGQVMFDGRPAAGARLSFVPLDRVVDAAPSATAIAAGDGTFRVRTAGAAQGLPAGDYAVAVEWRPMIVDGEDYRPGQNVIPPLYSLPGTTPLVAHVALGRRNELRLTLKTCDGIAAELCSTYRHQNPVDEP